MNHRFTCLLFLFLTPFFLRGDNNPDYIAELLNRAREQDVHFVEFAFTDLLGNLKRVTYPIAHAEKVLRDGAAFDGSSIPGCSQITESDMLLKPDIGTAHIVPWTDDEQTTLRFMCDIYVDENTPYKADPRHILREAIYEARELGYQFFVGPELEFFVCRQEEHKPADGGNYFGASTNVIEHNAQCAIMNALRDQGVNVEKWHHEVAPGQHEISLRYGNALAIADQVIIARHTLKTLAHSLNLHISFMPKPFFGKNGSAMHVHFSLFDPVEKRNVFHADDTYGNLSSTAQSFIAGVLEHVHDHCALLNQSINSYKRLVRGYEAPINICWGTKNRSALIRIPHRRADETQAARAEIRSPDSLCNPYLVFAFILKAGLDGIKNKKELAPAVEDNLYYLTSEQLRSRGINELPSSLHNAVAHLQRNPHAIEFFGEDLINEFVKLKRRELADFNTAITNWEHAHYW